MVYKSDGYCEKALLHMSNSWRTVLLLYGWLFPNALKKLVIEISKSNGSPLTAQDHEV